jgi:hypothetical protein
MTTGKEGVIVKANRIVNHLLGATVLLGTSLGSLAWAGQASAAPTTKGVLCRYLVGDPVADTARLTGCSTPTGGSGTIASFVPGGGKVTWKNRTTTTYTSTFTPGGTACPPTALEFNIAGKVTKSTNRSIPKGSPVRMTVCLTSKLTNGRGTVVRF